VTGELLLCLLILAGGGYSAAFGHPVLWLLDLPALAWLLWIVLGKVDFR
jgi:hypothetical protein